MPTICVGCGLSVAPNGDLMIELAQNPASTPYPVDCGPDVQELRCDPDRGLWSIKHRSVANTVESTLLVNQSYVGSQIIAPPYHLALPLCAGCRCLYGVWSIGLSVDVYADTEPDFDISMDVHQDTTGPGIFPGNIIQRRYEIGGSSDKNGRMIFQGHWTVNQGIAPANGSNGISRPLLRNTCLWTSVRPVINFRIVGGGVLVGTVRIVMTALATDDDLHPGRANGGATLQ
jgi:hypothetical protein